jgi:hypothetical protein
MTFDKDIRSRLISFFRAYRPTFFRGFIGMLCV